MEENIYYVYEGHMEDLKKKINRIKNKCMKFGCDFTFEEVGEDFREIKMDNGEIFVARYVLIKAEGTAIINGWEFVSSVEHTEAGNIFSKAMTTVEIPAKYRTTKCICEHCNSNRIRKNTCIIRNIETGEFKQVGNSCLMDFTHGMSASVATWFASIKDVFEEAQEAPVYGSTWFEKNYSTREILQFTAETIRHFGYSKSENDGDSTKQRMQDFFNFLHGNTRWWSDEDKKKVKNLIDQVSFNPDSEEAIKMTDAALEWISEQPASNDYMHNLKVATSLKYSNSGRFGILVSLFPTFNRELEFQAKKRQEAEQGTLSKHIGQVGDRLLITVDSVKCLTSWESCFDGYNTTITYIWKIVDKEGNVFTWKTSKWLNEEVPPKSIKGTVKEHKEFRGVLQTELTRCIVQAAA